MVCELTVPKVTKLQQRFRGHAGSEAAASSRRCTSALRPHGVKAVHEAICTATGGMDST